MTPPCRLVCPIAERMYFSKYGLAFCRSNRKGERGRFLFKFLPSDQEFQRRPRGKALPIPCPKRLERLPHRVIRIRKPEYFQQRGGGPMASRFCRLSVQ